MLGESRNGDVDVDREEERKKKENNFPPPLFGGVTVAPKQFYLDPHDVWKSRLQEQFAGAGGGQPDVPFAIASRVASMLPPGYERGRNGEIIEHLGNGAIRVTDERDPDFQAKAQLWRDAQTRRLLGDQMRRNIWLAKRTTGRPYITPQEYVSFASQAGFMPSNLDTWIPYYGMNAANAQTQRDALNREMQLRALAAGAAIDSHYDDVDQRMLELAMQERNDRINAIRGFAAGRMQPPPPYAPPSFPLGQSRGPDVGQAYGTTVAAAAMDAANRAMAAIDQAVGSGRIDQSTAEELKRSIIASMGVQR